MSFLTFLFLHLALPSAHAACTIHATAPTAGSTLTAAPTFQWTQAGCNAGTLLVAPQAGGSWTALTTLVGNGPKSYALPATDWSTWSTGAWASGMCWRVVGRVFGGSVTFGPSTCVDVSADADGDGWTEAEGDCDDSNSSVYPGAPAICDDWIDDDCDGWVEEYDMDGDGWTICAGDCDDDDYSIQPDSNWEVCNGRDDDCDGIIDGDNDGDGYAVCDDCADYAGGEAMYPGATEIPDNYADDDCDGMIDESP